MRRFVVAQEGFADRIGADISLEEEQILLTEAASDQAEVASDLAEAERVIEVSDSLEDLAVVADGIEEATPAEAALVEVAGDMATAGTDVAGDELIPAQEAFIGRKLAVEGIRETARNIWASIQAFLKKIWEKIEGFFYKIFGTIPRLRKSIEALQKRADDASGNLKDDGKDFTMTSGLAGLCEDFKAVKTGGEFKAALGRVVDATKASLKDVPETFTKVGELAVEAIADFEPAKAQEGLKKFVDDVEKLVGNAKKDVPGSSSLEASYAPGFDCKGGAQLLGNVRLVAKSYKSNEKDGLLGSMEMLRRSGVEVARSREKDGTLPSEVKFKTMTTAEISDVLKEAAALLDVLEDYKRGKAWGEVRKVKGKLETASAKATSKMESMKGSEEADEKAAYPYYKSLLNFNTGFAKWVQQPAMPMFGHALTAVRTAVILAEKSLAQYKG